MPEVSPGWMADGCGDILKITVVLLSYQWVADVGRHIMRSGGKFAAAAFGVKLDDSGDDESGCRGGAS